MGYKLTALRLLVEEEYLQLAKEKFGESGIVIVTVGVRI